jgi:hypothetical protein
MKSENSVSLLAPVQERMHPLFEKASGLTETIIAAAIEVHRDKGPGLIESIYEWCLIPLGLLINFHELKVTDGISRLILPGANQ